MNTFISKPTTIDDSIQTPSAVSSAPLQPALARPALHGALQVDEVQALQVDEVQALQVDEVQTLPDVMNAIREDCCENSLQYVLRSDTGHDGE